MAGRLYMGTQHLEAVLKDATERNCLFIVVEVFTRSDFVSFDRDVLGVFPGEVKSFLLLTDQIADSL